MGESLRVERGVRRIRLWHAKRCAAREARRAAGRLGSARSQATKAKQLAAVATHEANAAREQAEGLYRRLREQTDAVHVVRARCAERLAEAFSERDAWQIQADKADQRAHRHKLRVDALERRLGRALLRLEEAENRGS